MFKRKNVKTGLSDSLKIEIIECLNKNDTIKVLE